MGGTPLILQTAEHAKHHIENLVPGDLDSSGLLVCHGFLSPATVRALNDEIDTLICRPSINGSMGGIHLARGYREIMLPTLSIMSVNLLEMSLRVRDLIIAHSKSAQDVHYELANIEVFSEEDNHEPLMWHTDNRQTMLRAMIYLRGGQGDSGAFQYMRGSHSRDYYVEHELPQSQVDKLRDTIYDCVAPEGSIIAFDPMGFHAKLPTVKNRRTIMFEIQPSTSRFPKSATYISGRHLTPLVVNNSNFFTHKFPSERLDMGLEEYFCKPKALDLPNARRALRDAILADLKSRLLKFRFVRLQWAALKARKLARLHMSAT
jgi:hypothetical protein